MSDPIIAAIQMTSGMDLDHNLKTAKKLLQQAVEQGACVAVLPENFPLVGKGPEFEAAKRVIHETESQGPVQSFLSETARELKLWIVGGTIPLASSDPLRSYASCLVYNDQGQRVARYDKIHLFDVDLGSGHVYHESEICQPGSEIVVVDSPAGKLGLSVCYDLRFPELFRALIKHGAEILIIPAAFTVPTGRLHWEVLCRARAIENCAYVVAAAQSGIHGQGRETYGHSLIISPTGEILQELPAGEGVICVQISPDLLKLERQKIPAWDLRIIGAQP